MLRTSPLSKALCVYFRIEVSLVLKVWNLFCKSTELGRLEELSADQPWFTCEFHPTPNYENHRDFFTGFEKEYKSGTVKNFNDFFAKLQVNGYKLIFEDRKSERFIILKTKAPNTVRLRATYNATT